MGSVGSSSRATSQLGPQCLPLVPGAAQDVGDEGQEAMTAGGALGVGLCVGGTRALTLPPCFHGARICLAGSVSISLSGWALCECPFGPGLVLVGPWLFLYLLLVWL